MNDQEMMGTLSNDSAYRDNMAHREHNPYKDNNAYQTNNSNRDQIQREKKKPWELDYRIIRFFRENFNAGIDFEESPRNFFDEEHMLSIRLGLLGRNSKVIFLKFIVMSLFSIGALFLTSNGALIVGFIYILLFLYHIVVPIAFVKYCRQYIMVDDKKTGKLRKIHDTYSSWIRPLEAIAMNTFSIFFLLFEVFLFFNTKLVLSMYSTVSEAINNEAFSTYLSNITVNDIYTSIAITSIFYFLSYLIYWIFIYQIWVPKWEAKRKDNLKQWTRTNQKTADNLMNELTKVDE